MKHLSDILLTEDYEKLEKAVVNYRGLRHLVKLWNETTNNKEKNEIVLDIMKLLSYINKDGK